MIWNFSLRQRLHLLLELLYGECDERMRQEIKCSMLLSLRVQICLLSSVELLCFPSSGHAFFCRQLHVLFLMVAAAAISSVCIDAVRMRLLWLSIICFVLFMQL